MRDRFSFLKCLRGWRSAAEGALWNGCLRLLFASCAIHKRPRHLEVAKKPRAQTHRSHRSQTNLNPNAGSPELLAGSTIVYSTQRLLHNSDRCAATSEQLRRAGLFKTRAVRALQHGLAMLVQPHPRFSRPSGSRTSTQNTPAASTANASPVATHAMVLRSVPAASTVWRRRCSASAAGAFGGAGTAARRHLRPLAFWNQANQQPDAPAGAAAAAAGSGGTSSAIAATPGTASRRAAGAAPRAAAPRRDFLEARQVSLFELFTGTAFKFDIPDYQRPYSWRPKQVWSLLVAGPGGMQPVAVGSWCIDCSAPPSTTHAQPRAHAHTTRSMSCSSTSSLRLLRGKSTF